MSNIIECPLCTGIKNVTKVYLKPEYKTEVTECPRCKGEGYIGRKTLVRSKKNDYLEGE